MQQQLSYTNLKCNVFNTTFTYLIKFVYTFSSSDIHPFSGNRRVYLQQFKSMKEFKSALRKYIEYYNNERIKIKLKGKSPVQFRTLST